MQIFASRRRRRNKLRRPPVVRAHYRPARSSRQIDTVAADHSHRRRSLARSAALTCVRRRPPPPQWPRRAHANTIAASQDNRISDRPAGRPTRACCATEWTGERASERPLCGLRRVRDAKRMRCKDADPHSDGLVLDNQSRALAARERRHSARWAAAAAARERTCAGE